MLSNWLSNYRGGKIEMSGRGDISTKAKVVEAPHKSTTILRMKLCLRFVCYVIKLEDSSLRRERSIVMINCDCYRNNVYVQ